MEAVWFWKYFEYHQRIFNRFLDMICTLKDNFVSDETGYLILQMELKVLFVRLDFEAAKLLVVDAGSEGHGLAARVLVVAVGYLSGLVINVGWLDRFLSHQCCQAKISRHNFAFHDFLQCKEVLVLK